MFNIPPPTHTQALIATMQGAQHLLPLLRRDEKNLTAVHSAAGALLATLVNDPEAGPLTMTVGGGVEPFLHVLTDKGAPSASKRAVRGALAQLAGSVPAAAGGVWGWWTGQVGSSVCVFLGGGGGV